MGIENRVSNLSGSIIVKKHLFIDYIPINLFQSKTFVMAVMAELTSLKKQRSAAKQKFTRYFNLLSELIKEDADILETNVLFDDVSGAWRVVELRNDEYINMVPDDNTENCDEWIASIEKNYINIRKEVLSIKRRTERKDLCESSKEFV